MFSLWLSLTTKGSCLIGQCAWHGALGARRRHDVA
jgi:hypothetical protein